MSEAAPPVEHAADAAPIATVKPHGALGRVVFALLAALVVLVVAANAPPTPVLLHVTTLPDVDTALLFRSASRALIVTALPDTGLELLDVTRYFAGSPGSMAKVVLVSAPSG